MIESFPWLKHISDSPNSNSFSSLLFVFLIRITLGMSDFTEEHKKKNVKQIVLTRGKKKGIFSTFPYENDD